MVWRFSRSPRGFTSHTLPSDITMTPNVWEMLPSHVNQPMALCSLTALASQLPSITISIRLSQVFVSKLRQVQNMYILQSAEEVTGATSVFFEFVSCRKWARAWQAALGRWLPALETWKADGCIGKGDADL